MSLIYPEYITTQQAAELTGFSLRALETMRSKRIGPAYIKIGKVKCSAIRYRLDDVRQWLEQHKGARHDG